MTFSWTSPRTWATSEVDTAAFLNAEIRDNQKALTATCRAFQAYTGLGTTIGPTTTAALTFTGVSADPLGMWSIANPTRITVPVAGWYRFIGKINANSTSSWTAKIFKNGALANTGTSGTGLQSIGEFDIQLAANDYVELEATTGAAFLLTVPDANQVAAELVISWVSP